MNENQSDVICIIGMHRSGTSMIARLLNLCGLDLGPENDLLGPHESNPMGHFENLGFLEINEKLLSHFGGTWNDPPKLKPNWEHDLSLKPIVDEAKLLLQKFSHCPCWGWKEPRTTLLIPFWRLLIPNLRFVICSRNPLDVAESLSKRNGIPIEEGVSLWNHYMRAAILGSQGSQRIFISYEDFFKDLLYEAGRVIKFCKLNKSIDESILYNTVSPELKHHTSMIWDLLKENRIVAEYKLFYLGLTALLSKEMTHSGDSKEISTSESVEIFLDLLESFISERKILQLERLLTEKDRQISEFKRKIADTDQEIEKLKVVSCSVGKMEEQIKRLEVTIEEREKELIQLQSKVAMVESGVAWKILSIIWRLRERYLPSNSKRRKVYDLFRNGINTLLEEGVNVFLKRVIEKFRLHRTASVQKKIIYLRERTPADYSLISNSIDELPPLDIVIITYFSEEHISRCIDSIFLSDYPNEKMRIIIVDNNSKDRTIPIVENMQQKNIHLIKNSKNSGFGLAVNLAFTCATSKYVFVLNPDTELTASTLKLLVTEALLSEKEGFCAWEARQEPFEHPKIYDPVTRETEWISGACFLISRQVFNMVSGFDPNIFLYAEDVDLSWRLRKLGYRLRYVPCARVVHKTYSDPSRVKESQFFNSIVSNLIIRVKYGTVKTVLAFWYLILETIVRPIGIRRMRFQLICSLVASGSRVMKAFTWRLRNKETFSDIAQFNRWNYEIRRRGDFYINRGVFTHPLISVVVRTKNRPYFLREALQSIRNQTYQSIELVVVEDGPQTSNGVIDKYKDLNIKYMATEISVGRCCAGNLGLSKTTGKYINFLDDDDLFFADHLEVLCAEIEQNGKFQACYSTGFEVQTHIISTEPLIYQEMQYDTVYEKSFNRAKLKLANYIPINCMLFSREIFEKEGGFDEKLDVLEDWDLWLRYSHHFDFAFVEKTTCIYRVPASSKLSKERQEKLNAGYEVVRAKHQQCCNSVMQ